MEAPKSIDLETLRELVRGASVRAAQALGRFLGHTLRPREPRVVGADAARDAAPAGSSVGVFFEVEGELAGHVAVLLPELTAETMLGLLLGSSDKHRREEAVTSVFREIGNIVASRALSEIANRLRLRVLPSIPILVLERPDAALAALVARSDGEPERFLVETELVDADGLLSTRLVFVPDLRRPPGS